MFIIQNVECALVNFIVLFTHKVIGLKPVNVYVRPSSNLQLPKNKLDVRSFLGTLLGDVWEVWGCSERFLGGQVAVLEAGVLAKAVGTFLDR